MCCLLPRLLLKLPTHIASYVKTNPKITSKFGEFISLAEVSLVCLKFSLSFIKFCPLVAKLWLICGF